MLGVGPFTYDIFKTHDYPHFTFEQMEARKVTQLINDGAQNHTVTLAPKPTFFPLPHAVPKHGVLGDERKELTGQRTIERV